MKYNYELTLEDLKKANKEYFCKYFLTFVIFSIIGFITIITLIISGVLSETILRKIKALIIILTIFFICSIVFVFQNLKSRKNFKNMYKNLSILRLEVDFDNGQTKFLNNYKNPNLIISHISIQFFGDFSFQNR